MTWPFASGMVCAPEPSVQLDPTTDESPVLPAQETAVYLTTAVSFAVSSAPDPLRSRCSASSFGALQDVF